MIQFALISRSPECVCGNYYFYEVLNVGKNSSYRTVFMRVAS